MAFVEIFIRKLNGTLTNEDIAEFSHQSYIIISQQKLDKRLDIKTYYHQHLLFFFFHFKGG